VTTTELQLSTGADLAAIRERKPLVHQITNYVVMNETANATLALGALPVMAHAREEVAELVALAGALVLNIGTLSPRWVEAMLAAGRAATLAGREAEIRGVESIGADDSAAELAHAAARKLGTVAAVTGATDYVSDGRRTLAVANGDRLLATITGSGCMSTAITGCFLAVRPESPLAAAAEALAAFGVAGEEAAREAKGPGSFHAGLYDALYTLDPATLDEKARVR
jgi:hydroxyethylthiazole kinase